MVNIALTGYMCLLLFNFWESWKVHCIRQLNVWLLCYTLIEVLQIGRTVVKIYIWRKKRDPPGQQIKVEIFFGIWLFMLEVAWQIYGNTFIYEEEIQDCKAEYDSVFGDKESVKSLRVTCLVLIVYGYILMLGLCFLIIFYTGAYFGMK